MADTEKVRQDRVQPLLKEIEQLRLDLTSAANWIFGRWPLDFPVPYVAAVSPYEQCVQIGVQCATRPEFAAVAQFIEGVYEDGENFDRSRRQFGDRVSVMAYVEKSAAA